MALCLSTHHCLLLRTLQYHHLFFLLCFALLCFALLQAALADKVGADLCRPLDHHLTELKTKLTLRSALYVQPKDPLEKALLLVEQAKGAKNDGFRSTVLLKAARILGLSDDDANGGASASASASAGAGPASGTETAEGSEAVSASAGSTAVAKAKAKAGGEAATDANTAGSGSGSGEEDTGNDVGHLQRTVLCSDIMSLLWALGKQKVASRAANYILQFKWHPKQFRNLVFIQTQACLTLTEMAISNVHSHFDKLDEEEELVKQTGKEDEIAALPVIQDGDRLIGSASGPEAVRGWRGIGIGIGIGVGIRIGIDIGIGIRIGIGIWVWRLKVSWVSPRAWVFCRGRLHLKLALQNTTIPNSNNSSRRKGIPHGAAFAVHSCIRFCFRGTHFHFHFVSFHFTSFHFISLHFTSFHFTSLHFTSLHFTSLPQAVELKRQVIEYLDQALDYARGCEEEAPWLVENVAKHAWNHHVALLTQLFSQKEPVLPLPELVALLQKLLNALYEIQSKVRCGISCSSRSSCCCRCCRC